MIIPEPILDVIIPLPIPDPIVDPIPDPIVDPIPPDERMLLLGGTLGVPLLGVILPKLEVRRW